MIQPKTSSGIPQNTQYEKDKIHRWLETNNFCAMPFFHVAIESNGDVRPCCLGRPLKNEDGSVFNSAGMSINQVINHPTHIKFRQSFKDNQQHASCEPCWGEYHNDRFSGRYTYSASLKVSNEVLKIMAGSPAEQKLVWLEIKAGNRCNLSCRICGIWNSAKWLKETYEFKKSNYDGYPELKNSEEFAYNQQAKWIDDVDFWKNVEGFDDIKIIHLMGGEPLMIEEHYEMLRSIAEKFDPSEIIIWYNTNGTVIPTAEQELLLSKFKRIMWSISIDDFGNKFDYQRKGASWSEVKDNLTYFFSKSNYQSLIDTTINVHNIATIHHFISELESLGIADYLYPHFVTTPKGIYNIRTLHPDIKKQIVSILESNMPTNVHAATQVKDIIRFMMSIDDWSPTLDASRKRHIEFIDRQRNESFIETFPEMAKLLGYE
jgi:MoaA/NifB/PqqE/SkfB family radical SAM enzyme